MINQYSTYHTSERRIQTIQTKVESNKSKIKPLVKIEIEKLKKVGIISPIRHSDWLSNLVVVRKRLVKSHFVLILGILIESA
jgi:uncharacterized protein YjgD (DUF1641 family)